MAVTTCIDGHQADRHFRANQKGKPMTAGADADKNRGDIRPSDDYGHVGIEEFSRRIQEDNDKRYGELIRSAKWKPVGDPGW